MNLEGGRLLQYGSPSSTHIQFSTVEGFFMQDDPNTDPETFDYATSNLGLIERQYPTDEVSDPHGTLTLWEKFEYFIKHLNADADSSTRYKLLYLGRHGLGFHNVAEANYGREAWDCYWSMLDGNGTLSWKDADLTAAGVAQAKRAHEFWKAALEWSKIPAPERYYSSPLHRCMATANYTYAGLDLPTDRPFKPLVKELFRETLGVHTCDQRSTATQIRAAFPDFEIEAGFAEEDPLWMPNLRESDSQLFARMKTILDEVFNSDPSTFISVTSHSGAITTMLRVLGHRSFYLQTGGIIPVLVKAVTVPGPLPTMTIEPGHPPPTCTIDASAVLK